MKVIIAGSRSIVDKDKVFEILDNYFKFMNIKEVEIVSGGARGIDTLAFEYASEKGMKCSVFMAKWTEKGKFDKGAGLKRNKLMGDYADALVAIWDGVSTGTQHMIDYMEKNLKPYKIFTVVMGPIKNNS